MTEWGELYAHIAACTGWTWDYIAEHVDLSRLDALNRYWTQWPPLHVMAAAYLGLKPSTPDKQDSIDELLQLFPLPNKLSPSNP